MKDVASFFRVLSDEARLEILWLLANHDELCVCDIMEALGITQSKASRHLATLRHAGLVRDRKVGAWSYYSRCPAGSALARGQLEALCAGLAAHPSAAEVLSSLRRWLARKPRKSCPAAGAGRQRQGARPRAAGRGGRAQEKRT